MAKKIELYMFIALQLDVEHKHHNVWILYNVIMNA